MWVDQTKLIKIKENDINELYDNFECDRGNTLDLFESVGFEVVEEQTWKKFSKDVKGVLVKKVLKRLNVNKTGAISFVN
jgi:hypothetical protein